MTAAERLLRYVQFDTQSNEFSDTCPSTDKQKALALALVEEMRAMGISDAYMDAEGYVYGTVPGDPAKPVIGLIAHMDTAPDASGANIRARIVPYEGGDIVLNEAERIVMKEADFPSLTRNRGKHLIVTDGTTLLGADDKAGVAEPHGGRAPAGHPGPPRHPAHRLYPGRRDWPGSGPVQPGGLWGGIRLHRRRRHPGGAGV